MKPRSWRLWLAMIVLVFSAGLLIATLLPPPRDHQSVPLPAVTVPAPQSWHPSTGVDGGAIRW